MVKVSINRYAPGRFWLDVDVFQGRLRLRLIEDLGEIFSLAARVVRGEARHLRIGGRVMSIILEKRKTYKNSGAED